MGFPVVSAELVVDTVVVSAVLVGCVVVASYSVATLTDTGVLVVDVGVTSVVHGSVVRVE